ncbi:MAG: hypothetical protein IJU91_08160 [Selenomonadaceae bacterium]|nr:hypothetical protein [Selenomonadaceae bacterium]
MCWTIEFIDGSTRTYDNIEEVQKDGKIYKTPFNNWNLFCSGKIMFVHSDGHQTYIDGDKIKVISIP